LASTREPRLIVDMEKILLKIGDFIKKEKILFPISILLISIILVCFFWFRGGYLIAGSDFCPPFNPIDAIKNELSVWSASSGGSQAFLSPSKISGLFLFWSLFKLLGLSLLTIEKLWFIFLLFSAGVFMYYLLKIILPSEKFGPGRIVGSFFYIFNIFVIFNFFSREIEIPIFFNFQ